MAVNIYSPLDFADAQITPPPNPILTMLSENYHSFAIEETATGKRKKAHAKENAVSTFGLLMSYLG